MFCYLKRVRIAILEVTDTVDAALEEIVNRRKRERLIELLSDPSTSDLADPEVMAGAWR
jgi:hypothetical protein